MGFLADSVVMNLCARQEMLEMQNWSLGQEDPLEEKMAIQFRMLAWGIPWAEEPGGLQSIVLQKVRHNWENEYACTDGTQYVGS